MSCVLCEISNPDEKEIPIGRGPFGHVVTVHLSCYLRRDTRKPVYAALRPLEDEEGENEGTP